MFMHLGGDVVISLKDIIRIQQYIQYYKRVFKDCRG